MILVVESGSLEASVEMLLVSGSVVTNLRAWLQDGGEIARTGLFTLSTLFTSRTQATTMLASTTHAIVADA